MALLLAIIISAYAGYGEIVSPIPSSFTGVSTPNTHLLEERENSYILRGGTPRGVEDMHSLKLLGIKKILILKNEVRTEVQEEIQDLKRVGFDSENIIQIPLRWANFDEFKPQCEMTIEALLVLKRVQMNRESIYFHCTVGDDRTGYLSALWRKWQNPSLKKEEIFLAEMCSKGYEAKNKNKPIKNIENIRAYLTPLYIQMFELLDYALKTGVSLENINCENRRYIPVYNHELICS